jgi:hypothetical protein
METVSTNAVAVRRVREGGREYIVAPLSLIVPGVLNGSRGRLLYPKAEVASTARAWAGMPLVVYHPVRGGAHVSARDPEVLAAQGVGEVRSPRANGKLAAEGWFDVEKLRQVDNRVLARLERGDRVELSTGLFTDNDPVPGVHNGVAYDFIARNYRPDHVAVLPDEVGACSLSDGCGVNVNRAQLRHGDGQYGAHGDGTGSGSVHAAAASGALTEQDRELGRIAGEEAEAGQNPPSWVDDEAKWERAKRIADRTDADDRWAMVTYLYRRMGGMIANFSSDEERAAAMVHMREEGGSKSQKAVRATRSAAQRKTGESHKQAARAHERAGAHHRAAGKKQLANEHSAMAKEHTKKAGATVNREQTIEFLATNCSCWKGSGDRAVLETFSDDKLKQLRAAAERASQDSAVANAARKGAHGVKWDEGKQALVSNRRDDDDDDEDDEDSDMEDSDEEDSEEEPKRTRNQRRKQKQTPDKWLKNAPREVQSVVRNALAVERREKEQLIGRITANASSEELRRSAKDRLASKPLDELRELAALLAPSAPEPSYFGAAAPLADTATVNREDILPLPGMDEEAS